MKGIELSKNYFFKAGLPLLKQRFPATLLNRVAAGLVAGGYASGSGSEIGSFDDEISRDHNWGPCFFLFMSEADQAEFGKQVQAFLDENLPQEFEGLKLSATTLPKSRAYVVTPRQNLKAVLDIDEPPGSDLEWINIPEFLLFEYTSGAIFYEPLPLISLWREKFVYYPDEVWYKRLSFAFFTLHAAGNANRMAKRGDLVATQLYVIWLVECVMRTCFLLRRRYAPYRKWLFQAFKKLPDIPLELIEKIESLARGLDLSSIEAQMYSILDDVGNLANESQLIKALPLRQKSPFIWTDFNCYGFMQAFHEKLQGPLKSKSPYEGPLDLWMANHLPINREIMRVAWEKS
ncbi:MAG: DUF4037 domain-containing protein [Chroococcidiopsidaceae cyanobacterium CP_BM_RX_35]|nr:DUF4037 domain-containing protein [Chroococcidiopsidaceae cyanobacterium CP_BM_RX_35]